MGLREATTRQPRRRAALLAVAAIVTLVGSGVATVGDDSSNAGALGLAGPIRRAPSEPTS